MLRCVSCWPKLCWYCSYCRQDVEWPRILSVVYLCRCAVSWRKRLTSLLVCFILCFMYLPAQVAAQYSTRCGDVCMWRAVIRMFGSLLCY